MATMKRRIQKKLYLGEFAIKGFEFSCSFDPDASPKFNEVFDALIDYIEEQDLLIGGGGSDHNFEGYVTSAERYGSATEDDRAGLLAMLNSMKGLSDIRVDELTDAFHEH